MRSRVHAVLLPPEVGDFADEIRRIFGELGRAFGADSLTGECAPAVDVFETDGAMEITVDLPGVALSATRKGNSFNSSWISSTPRPMSRLTE